MENCENCENCSQMENCLLQAVKNIPVLVNPIPCKFSDELEKLLRLEEEE